MPSPAVVMVAVKPPPTAPVRGAGMLEMDGVLAAPWLITMEDWATPSAPV